MGLYGFKKRFIPKIKAKTKHHTIRARRKNEDERGSLMHLYYGLRTKQCELIGRVHCTKVEEVIVPDRETFFIEGNALTEYEKERLAIADGFENFAEMMEFWEGRFPFEGKMYHWDPKEIES